VAKGFSRTHSINFNETFMLVMKFVSFHTLLSFGVALDFEIHQMGIKYAFLNGDLDKSIYMTQLDGFEVVDHKDFVLKLKNKSMYTNLSKHNGFGMQLRLMDSSFEGMVFTNVN
jgi:hypothetical protein